MKFYYDDIVTVEEFNGLLQKLKMFEGDRFPADKVFHEDLRNSRKEVIALKNTVSITARQNKDNSLIGYLRILTDSVYIYYILDVMVDPDYRGKGVGYELVKLAVDKAKNGGFIKIFLTAIPGSENFYYKHGFREGMSPVLTIRGEDYV